MIAKTKSLDIQNKQYWLILIARLVFILIVVIAFSLILKVTFSNNVTNFELVSDNNEFNLSEKEIVGLQKGFASNIVFRPSNKASSLYILTAKQMQIYDNTFEKINFDNFKLDVNNNIIISKDAQLDLVNNDLIFKNNLEILRNVSNSDERYLSNQEKLIAKSGLYDIQNKELEAYEVEMTSDKVLISSDKLIYDGKNNRLVLQGSSNIEINGDD